MTPCITDTSQLLTAIDAESRQLSVSLIQCVFCIKQFSRRIPVSFIAVIRFSMTNIYREFEANIAKTLRVVQGTCAEPICKKIGLIAMVSKV